MSEYAPTPKILLSLLLLAATGNLDSGAQNPAVASDSIPEVTLNEVTVKAPRVIHKADMDVYIPSKNSVKVSQNGIALLRNLMIPTLNVNEIMGTVRTGGENVEIRINGRQASVEQLTMLSPSTVKRIEWIENPGLRYGDAPAVINVITVNPTAGGSFMAQGMQALDEPWGNGYLNLKLNQGYSQWEIGMFGRYTNKVGTYREYYETFTRPDGSSVTRTETPLDGYVSMSNINPEVCYSYLIPDKTTIWVDFSVNRDWPTKRYSEGLMELSDNSDALTLREFDKSSGTRPRLHAYIEKQLPHRQTIAVDASGSLFNGHSSHIYNEQSCLNDVTLSDVRTLIDEHTYTMRMEGNYIKKWSNGRLTSGIQYNGTRNRSTRENGRRKHQRRNQTYIFSEYLRAVGAVTLTGGIGAQYTDLSMPESDIQTSSWSLRPRLSAAYRLNRTSQFRVNFTTWQTTPSLSQTDDDPQQIDGFQYRIGNPDLHTFSTYRISAQYNLSLPRVNTKLEGRWTRQPGAIAPWMEWEDDMLITSFENSHGQTTWQVSLSPQIEVIPKIVTLAGTVRYIHSTSEGTGYRHTINDWSGNVSLSGTYRNFSLITSFDRNPASLSGEIITIGEKTSDITLSYRLRGLQMAVGMFMPFTRYSISSKSLNRYNKNQNILRSNHFDKMPFIRLAYNFSWGKQRKAAKKLIESSDDIDQVKAAGR